MAAPSDMAKLTKFARKRPIARQRPFDVTFLTRDEFSAGDPVFMSDDVTFTGTGAFSVVKSAGHIRLMHASIAYIVYPTPINDAAFREATAIARAEAETSWSPIFVGLCVTEGTRLQQSTAPGRITDGYRSIPTTIAGNQTMSMDAFMYLLGLRIVLEKSDITAMQVFDDFSPKNTGTSSAAMRKLVEDKMIHAGTRIVIGNKVLRLIETVMMGGHHKSTSVSVILSSLSD